MANNKIWQWIVIGLTAVTLGLAIAAAVLIGLFLKSGALPAATLPLGIATMATAVADCVGLILLWRGWRR